MAVKGGSSESIFSTINMKQNQLEMRSGYKLLKPVPGDIISPQGCSFSSSHTVPPTEDQVLKQHKLWGTFLFKSPHIAPKYF